MRNIDCNKLIEKYPELYKDSNSDSRKLRYKMQIDGFETDDGWFNLLDKLSRKISNYLNDNPIKGYIVHQVKSKYACLCYYPSHYNKDINKLISIAEHEANITCERCGSQENVKKRDGGWIVNWCQDCEDNKEKIKEERWSKK